MDRLARLTLIGVNPLADLVRVALEQLVQGIGQFGHGITSWGCGSGSANHTAESPE